MRHNQPLPGPIANAPEMPIGLGYYYLVFQELSSERTDGPIPGSAIRGYCRDEGLTDEEKDDLTYHVRNLDNALIAFRAKKAEDKGNKDG